MIRVFIFIHILLSLAVSVSAQYSLQQQWAKPLGGNLGHRNLRTIDKQGNKFVMTGVIGVDDPLFGSDSLNRAWVLVTDMDGNRVWSNCYPVDAFSHACFGKNHTIWAQSNVGPPDSVNNYRVGFVKLDSSGNALWYKLYGSTGENLSTNFITTSDGGALILSSTNSASGDIPYAYPGNGFSTDAWLGKLDSNGNIQWLKVFGGSGSEQPCTLKENHPGIYTLLIGTNSIDYMLAGLNSNDSVYCSWLLTVDSAGNILNSVVAPHDAHVGGQTQYFLDFILNHDGSLLLGGAADPVINDRCYPGKGSADFALIKTDNNYLIDWCEIYGGSRDEEITQMASINDSIIAIGGTSSSLDEDLSQCRPFHYYDSHVWFALINTNTRQKLWQKALCGSGTDYFEGFHYDSVEHALYVLVTGSSADGDFAGVAYNDSGNAYLFKYALTTTGINPIEPAATFKTYPNPATDFFTLQLDATGQLSTIELVDIAGRKIKSFETANTNIQIPLTNLPGGLYFVKVIDANGNVVIGKVVKE